MPGHPEGTVALVIGAALGICRASALAFAQRRRQVSRFGRRSGRAMEFLVLPASTGLLRWSV